MSFPSEGWEQALVKWTPGCHKFMSTTLKCQQVSMRHVTSDSCPNNAPGALHSSDSVFADVQFLMSATTAPVGICDSAATTCQCCCVNSANNRKALTKPQACGEASQRCRKCNGAHAASHEWGSSVICNEQCSSGQPEVEHLHAWLRSLHDMLYRSSWYEG